MGVVEEEGEISICQPAIILNF